MNFTLSKILVMGVILAFANVAMATGLTYHGRILKANGSPLEGANINFRVQIKSPGAETCLLYEETQTLNMTGSNGVFVLTIGDGTRVAAGVDGGHSMDKIFANRRTLTGLTCSLGSTTYTPAVADGRKLVVQFYDGATWETLPTQTVNFVPLALETLQVGGYKKEQLVRAADGVTTTELSQANWDELWDLITGASTNYAKTDGSNFNPSADVDFNGKKAVDLADPTNAQDAVTKNYADTKIAGKTADMTGVSNAAGDGKVLTWDQTNNKWVASAVSDASKLPLAGGTMTGAINMGTQNITNIGHVQLAAQGTLYLGKFTTAQQNTLVATPLVAADAGRTWYNTDTSKMMYWDGDSAEVVGSEAWVSSTISTALGDYLKKDGSVALTADWDIDGAGAGTRKITGLADPSASDGAATKAYVDSSTSTAGGAFIKKDGTVDFTGNQSMGGFTLYGNSTSGGDLTLSSTSHATKGDIILNASGGNVGIGTSSPTSVLHIEATTAPIAAYRHSNNNLGNDLVLGKSRGAAVAAPAVVQSGDEVGAVSFTAYDGNSYESVSRIVSIVNGTPGDGDMPGSLAFQTTPDGSATLATRMTIKNDGTVGIGTTSPTNKLQVEGGGLLFTGTTGAVPIETIGTHMYWYPGKAAFRAGNWTSATGLLDAGVGAKSFGYGINPVASGSGGFAGGINATASGGYSFAHGYTSTASGDYSRSLGFSSTASGHYSTAVGTYVTASSTHTIAMGYGVDAANPMVNSTAQSFGVGFNTTVPTFFVGPGTGAATTGKVGIGTTSPSTTLEVVGTVKATAFEGPLTSTSTSIGDGTAAAPSNLFTADIDTGLFRPAANTIGFSGGGAELFSMSSAGLVSPTTGGGAVTTGAGTAAAPTFSFAGDTDTGWFRAGADVLAAATAGTERVRIGSTGNVGIGTDSPGTRLEIESGGAPVIVDSSNSNLYKIGLYEAGAAAGWIGASAAKALSVGDSAGNERVTVLSGGDVGIGDTTPNARLHVYTNGTTSTPMLKLESTTGNATGGAAPAYGLLSDLTPHNQATATYGVYSYIRPQAFNVPQYAVYGESAGSPYPTTNVGVYGKSTQTDVAGGGYATGVMGVAAAGGVNAAAIGRTYAGYFDNTATVGAKAYGLYVNSAAGANEVIPFAVEIGGSEKLRVDSDGDLGVGTSTPGEKIEVAGNIKINGANGSNYLKFKAPTHLGAVGIQFNDTNSGAGGIYAHNYINAVQDYGISILNNAYPLNNADNSTGNLKRVRATYYPSKLTLDSNGNLQFANATTGAADSDITDMTTRFKIAYNGYTAIGTTDTSFGRFVVANGSTVPIAGWAGNDMVVVSANGGLSLHNYAGRAQWTTTTGQMISLRPEGITGLNVLTTGRVGINTAAPGYALDVTGDINASGSVRAAGVALTSDSRFKKDIEPIQSALQKIMQVRGVTYLWRMDEFPDRHFNDREQLGVIAQEVEKQFPQAVDTDEKGYKSVNYPSLVAPLIEAVKELYATVTGQNAKIEKAQREIASVKTENEKLKLKTEKLEQENRAIKSYLCAKDRSAPICNSAK